MENPCSAEKQYKPDPHTTLTSHFSSANMGHKSSDDDERKYNFNFMSATEKWPVHGVLGLICLLKHKENILGPAVFV